jgi:hypothetical protein
MHAVGEENTAKNASPLGIDFLAVVSGQSRPDQRVLAGKQLRVETFPQPLEQGRRALNVGKQERESLHRQSLGSQPRPATGHQADAPAQPPPTPAQRTAKSNLPEARHSGVV